MSESNQRMEVDQCDTADPNEDDGSLFTPSSTFKPTTSNTTSSSLVDKIFTPSSLLWNGSGLLRNMHAMRPKLCDVCLLTDDGAKIYAHRVVLASSMHYFSIMFTGRDYSTENSDSHSDLSYSTNFMEQNLYTIPIKNVDEPSLSEIVNYCYLGSVNINESNVQTLLAAATMFNCKDVITICCEFLRAKLSVSNALGIYSFSELMACHELKEETFSFILNNFTEISNSDEFLNLTFDRVTEIISSDYLDTGEQGELNVLNAVVKWLTFRPKQRNCHILELCSHVRFPQIAPADLTTVDTSYPILQKVPGTKDLLIEALKYHVMLRSPTTGFLTMDISRSHSHPVSEAFDLTSERFRKRSSRLRQTCVVVFGGQSPKAIRQCEYYDFTTNKWGQFVNEMPTRRCRAGVVVLNDLVYVIGGFNGHGRIRTVDVFDPKLNQWSSCASLEAKRSTLGVCILNGLVYAIGGFDGTLGLQSAEVYNPITRSWRFIASMSTRRSSVAVAPLNGYIYAVGGYDGASRECLTTVERYDPEQNRWSLIAQMSQRRSGAAAAVLNGKLYVFGGHDGPAVRKSVECYDPDTNKWSQCADMIHARRNAGVFIKDGAIYVVGGEDGHTNLKTVEIYDPDANSWKLLPDEMSIGRSYGSVALIEKTWS